MSGRSQYEKNILIPLAPDRGGRSRRLVLRFARARVPRRRVSAGFQVLLGETWRELVRYDDDPTHDGVLHRHRFGVDGPGQIDRWFEGVPFRLRGRTIRADVERNAHLWELPPRT